MLQNSGNVCGDITRFMDVITSCVRRQIRSLGILTLLVKEEFSGTEGFNVKGKHGEDTTKRRNSFKSI
jgi:hypothetical protein